MHDPLDAVMKLHRALKLPNLREMGGSWEYTLDEHWRWAFNGTNEPKTLMGVEVPPFSCYFEWNGWPAGIMNPRGGEFCAGLAANAQTFVEAVERKLDA